VTNDYRRVAIMELAEFTCVLYLRQTEAHKEINGGGTL
jgi:hypothetical protein